MDDVVDFLSQSEVDALLKGVTMEAHEWAATMSNDTRTRQELYDTLIKQFSYEINHQNLVIEDAHSRINTLSWCIDMIERQK